MAHISLWLIFSNIGNPYSFCYFMIMTSPNEKYSIHWFHHVLINLLLSTCPSVLCMLIHMFILIFVNCLRGGRTSVRNCHSVRLIWFVKLSFHSPDIACVWFMMEGISGYPGIILCMRLANERRRYYVTSSPIGWVHAKIVVSNHLWTRLFPRIYFVVICWDMGSECISLHHTGIVKGSLLGPCKDWVLTWKWFIHDTSPAEKLSYKISLKMELV